MPLAAPSHAGRMASHTYKSVLDGTLTIFGATMAVETLLFVIGIRGAAL